MRRAIAGGCGSWVCRWITCSRRGQWDPIATIADVLPGQTVEIIVQAVNGNLQGVASEPVQFTAPVLKASAQAPKLEPKATEAPGTNGNGHRNGHTLTVRA